MTKSIPCCLLSHSLFPHFNTTPDVVIHNYFPICLLMSFTTAASKTLKCAALPSVGFFLFLLYLVGCLVKAM